MSQDIWSDRFHWCALAAGFIAASEDKLHDTVYVKQLTYQFYEEGAFRERVQAERRLEKQMP